MKLIVDIMKDSITDKRNYRQVMNDVLLEKGGKNIKRFFALDSRVYEKNALDSKTKELIGLVASTILRCNDCIFYHLDQCYKQEVTDDELYEALSIALIIGGSITIPHLRFAVDMWEKLKQQ
jgi:AhpD family alkylhydroperoxidase